MKFTKIEDNLELPFHESPVLENLLLCEGASQTESELLTRG